MLTQSEVWFVEYCKSNRINFDRIEESENKTPDYFIKLDDQEIVVEVKEIQPSHEEIRSMEKAQTNGVGFVTGNVPGEKIRKKIKKASTQIKAGANGEFPSILLLCDIRHGCGQVSQHLDPYQLRVAMEGLDQFVISMSNDKNDEPLIVAKKSWPKKKMTQDANKSISALAVLSTPPGEPIKIEVYHNKFAAIPISEKSLRSHGIPQYKLSNKTSEPPNWVEM